MFQLYNGVLRAMATGGKIQRGKHEGEPVKDLFVTTIHAINSGVIKLGRLQPCCPVFRGLSGMKLPAAFLEANAHNTCGAVEFGFTSTTTDRSVAVQYSRGAKSKSSLIYEMRMGMISRGASRGWLSQYPEEAEILIPPLLAIELEEMHETADGTLVCKMGLNCNLQSKTIEE